MHRNEPKDGKSEVEPLGVPSAIDEAFRATNNAQTAFALRVLYRFLKGKAITSRTRAAAAAELAEYGYVDTLEFLEPVYNHVLENTEVPRSRRYNHGKRIGKQLGNLTCVLPVGVAQRFPVVIDKRHKGEVRHDDKYGQVYCSTTLRPQHLGVVGAACGLYANREFYERHGIVTPDGSIMVSERKLFWMVVSRGEPGGAGLNEIRRILSDLDGAHMWATHLNKDSYRREQHIPVERMKPARDRSIESNPIAKIQRLVMDDDGPRWADVDDERPTAIGHEHTIKIELAEWCRDRLDNDAKGKVFYDMKSWRSLSPEAARLMVLLQAERARKVTANRRTFTGVHFFAGREFCYMLGLRNARRYSEVRDSIFAWLLEIQRQLDRYEWVSQPYRRFKTTHFYDFTLRLKPQGSSRLKSEAGQSRGAAAPKAGPYTKAWLRDLKNFAALMSYRASDDEIFGHLLPPPT